jgi:hypothetical protein
VATRDDATTAADAATVRILSFRVSAICKVQLLRWNARGGLKNSKEVQETMNGWKGVTSGVIYREALELLAIARQRLVGEARLGNKGFWHFLSDWQRGWLVMLFLSYHIFKEVL